MKLQVYFLLFPHLFTYILKNMCGLECMLVLVYDKK